MTDIKQVPARTILSDIARVGQRFYDEPIQRVVSGVDPLAGAVAAAYGQGVQPISELSHYERRRLRWVVPDGKGGVVPRDAK